MKQLFHLLLHIAHDLTIKNSHSTLVDWVLSLNVQTENKFQTIKLS